MKLFSILDMTNPHLRRTAAGMLEKETDDALNDGRICGALFQVQTRAAGLRLEEWMTAELVPRPTYLEKIRPFVNTDIIKILTGVRRSGKSELLQLLQQDLLAGGVDQSHILLLNLEHAANIGLRSADALRAHIQQQLPKDGRPTFLFLDEVQIVPGWEDVVNSLRVSGDCDIYVTGSNAQMLSGELATLIAGRYVQFEVFPFSFAEFLTAYRLTYPQADEREAFRKFLVFGGFPYLTQIQYTDEAARLYLEDLFHAIELKDIIQRTGVRDPDLLERLLLYMLANTGTQVSARGLARYVKNDGRQVSTDKMLTYLRSGTDAFLYHGIPREDLRGKRRLTVADKYYAVDQGLREALIGGNMQEIQLILENVVCLELLRRGYKVSVGSNAGREIDFVAQKGAERLYIQVAYLLATRETAEREFSAFNGLTDNFPRYVLTMDEIDMSRDGIRHQNIRDFLLADQWQPVL